MFKKITVRYFMKGLLRLESMPSPASMCSSSETGKTFTQKDLVVPL